MISYTSDPTPVLQDTRYTCTQKIDYRVSEESAPLSPPPTSSTPPQIKYLSVMGQAYGHATGTAMVGTPRLLMGLCGAFATMTLTTTPPATATLTTIPGARHHLFSLVQLSPSHVLLSATQGTAASKDTTPWGPCELYFKLSPLLSLMVCHTRSICER